MDVVFTYSKARSASQKKRDQKMKTVKVACLSILMLCLCGNLSAQDEGKKKKRRGQDGKRGNFMEMIQKLDKNGDKALSADEIPERMARRLARFDTDGNGALEASELKSMGEKLRERMQGNGAQQSRDGKKGKRKGNRKGKGDGKGEAEGKRKGDRKGKGKGKAKGNEDGGKKGERGDMKRGDRKMPAPAELIATMDKNDDGMISKEEAPQRMQRAFDRIDANSDEQLDESELQKMAEMIKKRGGSRQGKKRKDGAADGASQSGVKPKRPGGGK